MTSSAAAIVPITLTVNDRTGLTLWAPPWEDEEGEEWQGFLGDGQKILLFPSAAELASFITSGEENDLSDHPGYGQVLRSTPDQLKPGSEEQYDLDQVYEWASGDPDPVHVSALADVVDMVAKIADCCDDGMLRRLIEGTPAFTELLDDENTYQGRDGRKRWNELGDTIAESWERAIGRVDAWLAWRGDFSETDFGAEQSIWDRVGAAPVELRFADTTYLTVRGEVPVGADDPETAVEFLGEDQEVAVFTDLADLARFCRRAKEHRLVKLEWWSELADVEDDEAFAPDEAHRYDLRRPSSAGVAIVRELAGFCGLEADTDVLDRPAVDKDDWTGLITELRTCLRARD